MKTVMKKIFSLMLVAVLLVSALPFQASAATNPAYLTVYPEGQSPFTTEIDGERNYTAEELAAYYSSAATVNGGMLWHDKAANSGSGFAAGATIFVPAGVSVDVHVTVPVTAPVCGHCSGEHETDACTRYLSCCGALDNHAATCANNPANATYTLTLELRVGETSNEIISTKSKSGLKGEINLKAIAEELFPTYTFMWTNLGKDVNTTTITQDTTLKVRMSAPVVTSTCPTCGDTYTGTTHTCPKCPTTNCALTKNHAGEHKCSCNMFLQKGPDHNTTCPYYEPSANNATLKVWANLITGGTKKGEIPLHTFTDLPSSALVYNVVSQNSRFLETLFPTDYEYYWSGHFYAEKDAKTVIDGYSRMTVGDIGEIYINLYTDANFVVVKVHTSKTETVDRLIQIDGFKAGQAISSSEVLTAVKKYYSVSNMKMYTETNWISFLNGKSDIHSPNVTVQEGNTIIHAYISGYAINNSGSSSSATADSTNPKTGDTIYMAVTMMAVSCTALAAIYFFNKKRAVK